MTAPKVVDCVTFFNELDLLELRLLELWPVVDRFVVVEARQTHRGAPKPAVLTEHLERFERFADKLDVYVVDLPDSPDPWVRENHQRQAILDGLAECGDEDVVLVSDVDELPDRAVVAQLRPEADQVLALDLSLRYYALNWEAPGGWTLARAARAATVRRLGPQKVREVEPDAVVPDAGWHLSCFYPEGERLAGITAKAKAFAHEEADDGRHLGRRYLQACIDHGFRWADAPKFQLRLRWCSGAERLPAAVADDPDRWSAYLVPQPRFHLGWSLVSVAGRGRASVLHRLQRARRSPA